jgi:hypothetical protein
MTIPTNTYSAIITKGLGFDACCALITAQFSLVCGCSINIVVKDAGGGPYQIPAYYTPINQKIDVNTRMVMITVSTRTNSWKKMYVVDRQKAAILIEIIGFINAVKDRTSIAVHGLRQTVRKVTAWLVNK